MSKIGQKEILIPQQHVIEFFKGKLGYNHLGNWKDRENNSNIEETLLTDWLKRQGHSGKIIGRVLTRNLPRRKRNHPGHGYGWRYRHEFYCRGAVYLLRRSLRNG